MVTKKQVPSIFFIQGGDNQMGNAKKWRKKKMAKHKHRKRLKKNRWRRRQQR
jgi:hypothetical protein